MLFVCLKLIIKEKKGKKERKADRCIQEGRQGQNMENFNADIIPGECIESFIRPFC